MKTRLLLALFVLGFTSRSLADEPKPETAPQFAGPTATGFLLPNGWHITPVGKQVQTTDLPLNIIPLKDSRHALVATSGFNTHKLSLIDLVEGKVVASDETKLKEYTAMVYRNCPYSDSQLTTAPHSVPTAIPTTVGAPSPIQYVIYIIKENRTYDQVFGDLAQGPNKKGKGE